MKPPVEPASDAEPLSLLVDTSSARISLALARGGRTIAQFGAATTGPTASKILTDIEFLLKRADVRPTDLKVLGAIVGPGSFTGLRVGLATIQGLGFALGLPVVTADVFEAVAWSLPPTFGETDVCVVRTAHREEIFTRFFSRSAAGEIVPLTEPRTGLRSHLLPSVLASFEESRPARGPLIFTGDALAGVLPIVRDEAEKRGLRLFEGVSGLASRSDEGWRTVESPIFLLPACIGLFDKRRREGGAIAAHDVLPRYVRPSDAELRKMECR